MSETEIQHSQEEVAQKPKAEKAKKFRKEFGYSLTMSKLMKKWNCQTPEAYRKLRNKHKKEHYVGPRTERNKVIKEESNFGSNDRSNNKKYSK
jgi:hypothetical protein